MNKHIFLTKWKATNAIFNDAEVQTECSVFEGTRFLLNSKNIVGPTQLIGYDPCHSFVRVFGGYYWTKMLSDRTIRCIISNLPIYYLTVPGMLLCRTR